MQLYKVSEIEWVHWTLVYHFLSFHSLTHTNSRSKNNKMHRNNQHYEIFGNKTKRNWHTTIISFTFTTTYSYARIIRFDSKWSARKSENRLVSALYFHVYEIQYPYNRVETNFTQKLKKKREIIRTNAPHKRLQFTHTSICTLCSKNKNKSKDKHNRIECCTRTAYSTIIVMSIWKQKPKIFSAWKQNTRQFSV